MDYVTGYLLALLVVSAGVVGVILSLIVLEVSRGKFALSFILSLIIVLVGGYYYTVVVRYERQVGSPNPAHELIWPDLAGEVIVPPVVLP